MPAGKRVSIYVSNEDPTPEEFDSTALKVEKDHPRQIERRWCGSGRSMPGPLRVHRRIPRRHGQGRRDRGIESCCGALVIVFREVLEAGLIIGIVMAATRGVPGRGRLGRSSASLAGVVGAGIIALFAGAIADAFEGSGQELLNASVLGVAVLMLMWHNAWMARHGREMATEMRASAQR